MMMLPPYNIQQSANSPLIFVFFHFSETTHPFVNPLHHPPSTMTCSLMSNTNADNNDATGIPPPVWLPTPRPMTDEELSMPITAAPTNEGASEMGPLEPSDSGTAPPSSKKAMHHLLIHRHNKISFEVEQRQS
jgi:hypothetical protein